MATLATLIYVQKLVINFVVSERRITRFQ